MDRALATALLESLYSGSPSLGGLVEPVLNELAAAGVSQQSLRYDLFEKDPAEMSRALRARGRADLADAVIAASELIPESIYKTAVEAVEAGMNRWRSEMCDRLIEGLPEAGMSEAEAWAALDTRIGATQVEDYPVKTDLDMAAIAEAASAVEHAQAVLADKDSAPVSKRQLERFYELALDETLISIVTPETERASARMFGESLRQLDSFTDNWRRAMSKWSDSDLEVYFEDELMSAEEAAERMGTTVVAAESLMANDFRARVAAAAGWDADSLRNRIREVAAMLDQEELRAARDKQDSRLIDTIRETQAISAVVVDRLREEVRPLYETVSPGERVQLANIISRMSSEHLPWSVDDEQ